MEIGQDRRGANFQTLVDGQRLSLVSWWQSIYQCKGLQQWKNKVKVALDLLADDTNREAVTLLQAAVNTATEKWSLLEVIASVTDSELNFTLPYAAV